MCSEVHPPGFFLFHFPVHTAFMCKQENLGWLLLTQRKKIPLKSQVFLEPYLGLLQCLSWYLTPPPQVREHSDHFDQADHWPWMGRGPSSPSFTHWPCRHHCRKNMQQGSHQRPPGKVQGEANVCTIKKEKGVWEGRRDNV